MFGVAKHEAASELECAWREMVREGVCLDKTMPKGPAIYMRWRIVARHIESSLLLLGCLAGESTPPCNWTSNAFVKSVLKDSIPCTER